MRKLFYFLCFFLLMMSVESCHDNRHCLDKAEAMFRVNNDSMLYYLLKVDTASLTEDEWYDYHSLRLLSYNNLMSLEKEEMNSILATLENHYAPDKAKTFRVRMLRIAYHYYRLGEYGISDSLLDATDLTHCPKRDSITWYSNKCAVKKALGEVDSIMWYLNKMMRLGWEEDMNLYHYIGSAYEARQQIDSAIVFYQKALEKDTGLNVLHYRNQILNLALSLGDVSTAWNYLEQLRKQMKRMDVPYMNLVEGDIWMEMHRPDSAVKHYRIAAETGNEYIASQAYERLGMVAQAEHEMDKAFDMYQKSVRSRNELYKSSVYAQDQFDFEMLKLKNVVSELKVERQNYAILILGLSLLVVVMLGGFVLFQMHRKRTVERNRLMQENRLLKQQEELIALREKDARMREELFKRMQVFEKLSDTEKEKHIQLSDTDWKEIQLMLDSGYDDFTKKLRLRFPMLSEKEINFCCLVKINVSLQSLSDIYCISKNSVSRRKLRLKEKMGIGEEETLDEFLGRLF